MGFKIQLGVCINRGMCADICQTVIRFSVNVASCQINAAGRNKHVLERCLVERGCAKMAAKTLAVLNCCGNGKGSCQELISLPNFALAQKTANARRADSCATAFYCGFNRYKLLSKKLLQKLGSAFAKLAKTVVITAYGRFAGALCNENIIDEFFGRKSLQSLKIGNVGKIHAFVCKIFQLLFQRCK